VRSFVALIAVVVASLLASACGDEKRLPTQPGDGGPVSETATFTRVQAEVFNPTCGIAGCHQGPASQAQEGLVLSGDAYSVIVSVRANQNASIFRVTPGDPANSYLWRKITPGQPIVGDRMPQTGSITEAQRQLLTDWILRGAPRD
jgi:hypothetical protein